MNSLDEIRKPVSAVMLSFSLGSLFTIFILGIGNIFIKTDDFVLISINDGILQVHNNAVMYLLFNVGLAFTYIPVLILVVVLLCKRNGLKNNSTECHTNGDYHDTEDQS